MKLNTFVIPIIQHTNIGQCLQSLHKHTPDNFNVIVIDNSGDDSAWKQYKDLTDIWLFPHRNLGFAKSMNTGIKLAQTKYVTLANDDLIFMNKKWWEGIITSFEADPKIVAVNPMSPKEASWGYGLTADNKDSWQAPKGFAPIDSTKQGIVPIIQGQPFPEKDEWTEEEYDSLLTGHPTWSPGSVCDAIAMWCTVFRRDDLIGSNARVGLLDERFYPGGGEDYDMNARAYSCAWPVGFNSIEREACDPDFHNRMVGSSRSWVWHKWGASQKISGEHPELPIFASRKRWNDLGSLWTPKCDVWGHDGEGEKRKPVRRTSGVFIDEL